MYLLFFQQHQELRAELVSAKVDAIHKSTEGALPYRLKSLSVVYREVGKVDLLYGIFDD